MINLYAHVEEGRLDVSGVYLRPDDYFRTTVYRFLALAAHAQLFEDEQIFIDSRRVAATDLGFVKFVKAFHWVMTDLQLFEGCDYVDEQDQFRSDNYRALCEAFLDKDRQVPSFRAFETRLTSQAAAGGSFELEPVFRYFDGVSPREQPLRWDRLVCLHLLTMGFLKGYGYDWEKPTRYQVEFAAARIAHPEVARNLVAWLPLLGLEKQEALKDVKESAEKRGRESMTRPLGSSSDLAAT
jgi:hypothetical protein